ncbi:MAG: serine protease [Candidatus Acidiferrales bacterium]
MDFESLTRVVKKMLVKCRTTAIVLLTFSVSCFGQSKPAAPARSVPNLKAAIENIRNAIVQVSAESSEGRYSGTGFIVYENYVVTNCHVVGLCRQNPLLTNPKVRVAFRIPDLNSGGIHISESFRGMSVEIVDTDFQNDLTLLKLPDNFQFTLANTIGFRGGPPPNIQPKASEARLSIGLPDEGTDVLISGYPFMEPSLVTQRGMIASHARRSNIENTSAYESVSDVLFVDAMMNEGNSGGPVYLPSSSEVIGVAEGFLNAPNGIQTNELQPRRVPLTGFSNSGLSFVIPAKYVLALLQRNNVPMPTAPRNSKAKRRK